MNYICDEAGSIGKGANVVISELHHYLENHGLGQLLPVMIIIIYPKYICQNNIGEKTLILHADNCCGQYKNNTMIQYLAWRVLTGRHTDISLSFLVVGHTKFTPDWCSGLVKRLYRRTDVGGLDDFVQVKHK